MRNYHGYLWTDPRDGALLGAKQSGAIDMTHVGECCSGGATAWVRAEFCPAVSAQRPPQGAFATAAAPLPTFPGMQYHDFIDDKPYRLADLLQVRCVRCACFAHCGGCRM